MAGARRLGGGTARRVTAWTIGLLPLIVAHRGASADAPENTLRAFREAERQGARAIEFDVRLARCGTPVVLHDATLRRTTSGGGRVLAHDAATLTALDAGRWFASDFAGEPVPTLAAVLRWAERVAMACNVELKAENDAMARATARAAAPLIQAAGSVVLVSSFVPAALAEMRGLGNTPLGVLVERRILDRHLDFARDIGAVSLHADRRAFGPRSRVRLDRAGSWPVAYTVNDVREAFRLHHELGVESLITDRPGQLLDAFGEHRREAR
ncbi:MAG: glycerophosphodiester phosphodiesterase [Geminicoccaceae bacterium]|nr:MAG: glycerophosphodiester phosphodiesterase [Geminicoccaceae bacterium]